MLLDYDLPDGKGDALASEIAACGGTRVIGVSSHQPGNEALKLAGAEAVCLKIRFSQLPFLLKTLDNS